MPNYFIIQISSYESFDCNDTFKPACPILSLHIIQYFIRTVRSRTRIKDLWESLHAADTSLPFLARSTATMGVQWRQLGLDPAGFKRRCRIGLWHRVLAKVSRYISISRRTIPTLSGGGRQPSRRATPFVNTRVSWEGCRAYPTWGGFDAPAQCMMLILNTRDTRHGTAKCAPRKTSASTMRQPLSPLSSSFRFDPNSKDTIMPQRERKREGWNGTYALFIRILNSLSILILLNSFKTG